MCETTTHCCTHIGPSPRRARLCCGCLMATPPVSSSYKTMVPGAACWGLLTLTRGDFTVSLGQTITTIHAASVSIGLCKLPLRIRQTWLLLRNPWRWCPSNRGNASVITYYLFNTLLCLHLFKKNKLCVFLETRKDEVCTIRSKFPNKLPVRFQSMF